MKILIEILIATVCVILAFALCNVVAVAAVALLITIFG